MMYDWLTGLANALTMPADITTMPAMYTTSIERFLIRAEIPVRSTPLPSLSFIPDIRDSTHRLINSRTPPLTGRPTFSARLTLAPMLQILHRVDVHLARAAVVHAQLPGVSPHPHVDHRPAAATTRHRGCLDGSPLGQRRRRPASLRVVRAADEPLPRLR